MAVILFRHWLHDSEQEHGFLRRLSDTLAQQGHSLVAQGRFAGPAGLETTERVEVSLAGLGHTLARATPSQPELPICWSEEFETEIVDWEAFWLRDYRVVDRELARQGARWWRLRCEALLETLRPGLLVVWNGNHAEDRLLVEAARRRGVAVRFIERGCLPGSVHIDPNGMLGDTLAASRTAEDLAGVDAASLAVADQITDHLRHAQPTWWSQPKASGPQQLARRLKIPEGATPILFVEQIDADIANARFSPYFDSSREAFSWFVKLMSTRNVFLLGKSHPKSKVAPREFQKILGSRGAWLTDAALHDCFALCEGVAAVNSTVLVEAVLNDKPALCFGDTLFNNSGSFYLVAPGDQEQDAADAFLQREGFPERQQRFRQALAALLQHDLYAIDPALENQGMAPVEALAERLGRLADESTTPPAPTDAASTRRFLSAFDQCVPIASSRFESLANKKRTRAPHFLRSKIKQHLRAIGDRLQRRPPVGR